MPKEQPRKIIHIDCDCFFASVEMRDNPALRDIPLAIGGTSCRGVISTCNYPARALGVRSAMSSVKAKQICPNLTLLLGRMALYSAVSKEVMAILKPYAQAFEPVSIDEAYLEIDPSQSASLIAQAIRQRIEQEVGITVSAGVAPNKFLAKIASAWQKPNGQTVIRQQDIAAFMPCLPLGKIPGIGPAQQKRLARYQLFTCQDVQNWALFDLVRTFGRTGALLFERAQGIDHSPVCSDYERKSLSVEHTFLQDLDSPEACLQSLPELWQKLQGRAQRAGVELSSLAPFIKVKFADFSQTTLTDSHNHASVEGFTQLLKQVLQKNEKAVRLLGLGGRLPEVDRQQLALF